MSFAINPSLNHIDLPEACVSELYRSSGGVLLQDARFRGHPCEAFICIAKIEKDVKAYVALLETGMKTVFVYTSDLSVSEPAEYPKVYAQAEAFVQALGFVMEPVNLAFSPAMREVIIKGFRVMRPPAPKKQNLRRTRPDSAAELRNADQEAALAILLPEELSADLDFPDAELESLQRELASAKAAIAQTTRDKVLMEQKAAQEIASLKAACEQAAEAKRKAVEALAAAERARLEESPAAGGIDAAAAAGLRDSLQAVTAAARATESRLQQDIAALQQELAAVQQREQQLIRGHQTLEERLAAAESAGLEQNRLSVREKESLLARITSQENAAVAAADKIAALANIESAWRQGRQREEDLCRSLDLLQSQQDRLEAELEQHRAAARREEELQRRVKDLEIELQQYHETGSRTEELQLRVAALEAELLQHQEREGREESLQLQVAGLEQELAAAREALAGAGSVAAVQESAMEESKLLLEEKLAVEAEYVRFANESREKELELHEAVTAARMEIERLGRELEIQVQVAVMEQTALRAELRRMVASGATAAVDTTPAQAAAVERVAAVPAQADVPAAVRQASPAAEQPPAAAPRTAAAAVQPAAAAEPVPEQQEEDSGPDSPIAPDTAVISGLMNEFGSFGRSSGYDSTEFRIDPELSAVAFSDPAEVVVLLYSSNTVQAVPDGSIIQRCRGYVVATKREGAYSVYVAWYLTESKSVVICIPQQQPVDSEECVRVLQDAVAYFEIVGFMMEVEELGESVRSYSRALRKVPVLRRMQAAA